MLMRQLNQAASQRAPMGREITARKTSGAAFAVPVMMLACACALLASVECQASGRPAGGNQEAPGGERPRLIPLAAAESGYSENSSVNLLCTVSQGHHESLQFEWFKDGRQISAAPEPQAFDQLAAGGQQPQIEKHPDHSLLRIARVQAAAHAGRYTCAAKSQFGQDSSSVNLIVNVKLQWIKEPAREIVVSLNQELKVDCLAEGEPKPAMRWEKHDSLVHQSGALISKLVGKHRQSSASAATGSPNHYHVMELPPTNSGGGGRNQLAGGRHYHNEASSSSSLSSSSARSSTASQEVPLLSAAESARAAGQGNLLVSSSRLLTVQRARESDAGMYECVASNGRDADLRKLVHVQVREKAAPRTKQVRQIKRRTLAVKANPQTSTFASISLIFKNELSHTLDDNEFSFVLATAIKTIHGDIANQPDILSFKSQNIQSYSSIIRFRTVHYTRVITSLLLFGQYKNHECKFEIHRSASTPCFLAI